MTDPSRAEAQGNSSFRQRPSELLRTYARDPQAPRPEEVQQLVSELDVRQRELEVQNQKLQEAQQQLQAYRDRYIDLYDFAPLGYATLDEDGYIQEINLAGARLLGGERAELVGYPFADYIVIADRATFSEHMRKCCGQHQDITSELGLITKDGRLLVVQLHSVPVESLIPEGTFGKTAITDITDRKRAEDAIQEERNLLRTVIDNLPDSIYVKDTQGRFVTANLAAARLTGATAPSDLLGKSDFDFYSEEVAAEYLNEERELVRSGETLINKDEPHPDPQGNLRTVLTTKVPLKDSRGTVVGLVGISRDITDQRRAETAIRESEQFYRTLIETLPVTVVLASPQGLATYISPAAKEMFDISPGEGLGTVPTDWIAPEHHEIVRQRMREVMVELRPQPPIEYKILKRDRTPVWAQVSSAPFLDNEGRLAGVVTVCQDVTARKQAEEALRENEARLRLAQQAASAGTWDLDLLTGRVIVSEETWGLWGVTPREAPESFDWLAAVYPEDRPLAETKLRQAMQHPGDARCEYRITWPDGQVRWHHARGRTLADPDGRPLRLVGITTDITERKEAEQRLRESEERLRLAIRGAEMGWWDWDLLSGEMTADDQCKALWGLPPTAQPSYELTMELTHPEDRPLLQQRLQKVLEAPDERDVEFRTIWPNSTVRWLLVRGRVFRDDRGMPMRLMGLVMDVTARKHAEVALRESETRFRALYEQAPLGIALINSRTGQFLQINPKYREIIQRSEEEMRKLTFQSITHPEDLQADLDNMARLIEGKSRFFNLEKRLFRGDGSLIWVSLTVVPMWEEGQLPRIHIAIIEDITERRQAEEAIRESEERMRLLVENTPLAVIEWGPDFRLSRWSIEAERVFGWKAEEVLGRQLHEFRWVHNEDSEAVSQVAAGLIDGTHARSVSRNRNYRKDGSVIYCEWYNSSLRDAAGKLRSVLSLVLDVTDRKLAEEALAAAKSVAEQANRAKDHFLAVLSHELRTPLTPVAMGVSMLQDRSDLAPAVRETLEMISHSIAMEARLIDDLLDVSRIAREKIELQSQQVNLCTVIQRVAEVCKPDIEARGLHFGVDLGAASPYWVEADAHRLQQVFWNLLKNAIKFTPHDGCVGIRCRPDQDHVFVEVNDSGIGIEQDALTRVFNAFEQEERSITRQFGGLGLGLAISKALVEMHGGTIEAFSEGRNKGATFRIRLPLASPVAQQEAQTPVIASPPTVRPLRVLLVEDHPVTAKMMQTVLSANGHTVQWASDVATALELADSNEFDLLMCDLGLPDGSGHDLMRQLRQRGHTFPGVALSGYGQEEDIQRSREAGFATHLTKPASREAVVEAIAAVTAR